MRLLCECSDGRVVGLLTAIQTDPYSVRGLVCEAFFQCLDALPDTTAFLRAEHSIRDALASFDGDQDRYVKAYVVSRFLDSRTRMTPRAQIIYPAFSVGGPLTLIGVFYSTFNVSRNPRNRETLDYLLGTVTESRNELFERARMFPRNPSTGPWFQQIVHKLELDARSLAYLLVCLGPHGIPAALLSRIRQPSRTWACDGEVVAHNTRIVPFLSDEVRFNAAVDTLQSIGFVKATSALKSAGLHIDLQLAGLVDANLVPWRREAIKLVCHAFPKHESIEGDSYTAQCESLLPCLQYLLSFQLEEGRTQFQIDFLSQAIESCLSSLGFGKPEWKLHAVSCAERLLALFAGRGQEEFEILRARVAVDKARMRQLYGVVTEQDLDVAYPRDNHRSNAFSAELAILRAQVQFDLNNLGRALEETASFDAAFHGSTSTLGTIMSHRVASARKDILRGVAHQSVLSASNS
ncbi:hypothetical protein F4861DRAFT_544419 [Xylaria intraflava]|nr:hypothetical protein F4861DRAFT_544419 [Xylaria intraflava]